MKIILQIATETASLFSMAEEIIYQFVWSAFPIAAKNHHVSLKSNEQLSATLH